MSKSSAQRREPFPNYRFRVEIDGVSQANFCEVLIPESSSQVIEIREGSDAASYIRKQAGLVSCGNLVLKWGLTNSMELYNWRKMVEQGKTSQIKRNISVVLLDEEANEAARWNFLNAWPCKYKAPDLNSLGNGVAIETLELAFESIQRVK